MREVGVRAAEIEQEFDVHACLLPGFQPGPQVEFVRPGIARLDMEPPVILGDVVGIEDAVLDL